MAIGAELQKFIDKAIWGSDPTADLVDPDTITGLSIAEGYGSEYSTEGGQFPEREGVNWIFHIATALAREFLTRGIPEWNAAIDYVHPAVCLGPDGTVYRSVRSNTGVNPVTDTDRSDWTSASLRGWSAVPAVVADGERRVLRLASWIGGDGQTPTGALQYLASTGLVAGIADGEDIRGPRGIPGTNAGAGANGWTPILAVVEHGARRVIRLVSWTGGQGTPPPSNRYLTESGSDPAIQFATDIRGPKGEDSTVPGPQGPPGATYAVGTRTSDLTVGSAFIDGVSAQKDVDNTSTVEIRVNAITTSAGMLRVIRDSTVIVDTFAIDAGVNQFVFGDFHQFSSGNRTYKFQVQNVGTLKKGSSIAVVEPS